MKAAGVCILAVTVLTLEVMRETWVKDREVYPAAEALEALEALEAVEVGSVPHPVLCCTTHNHCTSNPGHERAPCNELGSHCK